MGIEPRNARTTRKGKRKGGTERAFAWAWSGRCRTMPRRRNWWNRQFSRRNHIPWTTHVVESGKSGWPHSARIRPAFGPEQHFRTILCSTHYRPLWRGSRGADTIEEERLGALISGRREFSMATVSYAHIEPNAEGEPIIAGTRIKVRMIALDRIAHGWFVEHCEPLELAARARIKLDTVGSATGSSALDLLRAWLGDCGSDCVARKNRRGLGNRS